MEAFSVSSRWGWLVSQGVKQRECCVVSQGADSEGDSGTRDSSRHLWLIGLSVDLWLTALSVDLWLTALSVDLWLTALSVDLWLTALSVDLCTEAIG